MTYNIQVCVLQMSIHMEAAHLGAVVSHCNCGHPEELPTLSAAQQGPGRRTVTFNHRVQLGRLEQPLFGSHREIVSQTN